MPRALTLGNGDLLVNFDARYNMVDLYWPYVGRENQTDGHACRMGIWADGKFAWIEDGAWQKQICYRRDTLVSDVVMENAALGLRLRCSDAVDFHEPLLVREVNIEDLAGRTRDVRVFWHHDLRLFGYDLGDTVFFDPKTRCLVHYKAKRYAILGCFGSHGFGAQRWATGKKGFSGAQGTFVDAEDGVLSQNPIEQGSVDSTMGVDVQVPASGKSSCAMFLGMGETYGDVREQAERLRARSTAVYLRRTDAFWRLWVARDRFDYGELPAEVVDLFLQSLLILRTQIDNRGAIIAANDHDITSFARDTYSYMWPRDGSIVAAALDAAGHVDVTSHFYKFCARSVTADGYLLHKYNPDGSTASSWHPWVGAEGTEQLPIQEDETALVLVARSVHRPALAFVRSVGGAARRFDLDLRRGGGRAAIGASVRPGVRRERDGLALRARGGRDRPRDGRAPLEPVAETFCADAGAQAGRIVRAGHVRGRVAVRRVAIRRLRTRRSEGRGDDARHPREIVGADRRRRRRAVRVRSLPAARKRRRGGAGQSVVHLHAVARAARHRQGAIGGRSARVHSAAGLGVASRAAQRDSRRAIASIYGRALVRVAIDVVAR